MHNLELDRRASEASGKVTATTATTATDGAPVRRPAVAHLGRDQRWTP
ncbi:hypothetical protein [Streptosporangium sp. OZ121]